MAFMGKRSTVRMTMAEYVPGRRVSFEKEQPFPIRFGFEAEPDGDGTRLRTPLAPSVIAERMIVSRPTITGIVDSR